MLLLQALLLVTGQSAFRFPPELSWLFASLMEQIQNTIAWVRPIALASISRWS